MNKLLPILFFLWACASDKPTFVLEKAPTSQVIVKKNNPINLSDYSFPYKEPKKNVLEIMIDKDEEEFEKDFQTALYSFRTENEESFFNLGKKAQPLDKFIFPLKQNRHITSKFGMRYHPTKQKNLFHKGIDIRTPSKTNVLASASGRVIMSKHTKAYGNVVIIAHYRGISTVYAHNDRNVARVGETVKKGQIIALSGNSGDSTGPHLHFEIRQDDKAIEPLSFLKNQSKNL